MYMETDTIEFMIHVPQYWNTIGNPPGTLGRSTSVLTCMETDTLGFMIHVPQYWIHIQYFGRVQLWYMLCVEYSKYHNLPNEKVRSRSSPCTKTQWTG